MTPTQKTLMDYLHANPGGATKQEMLTFLPVGIKQVNKIVSELVADGSLAFVVIGGTGNRHHTRRYYAPEHAPQKFVKPIEFRRAKQRTSPPPKPLQGEARITSDTKVTICPPFADNRFAFAPTPGWKGAITQDWEKERSL